MAAHSPPWTSFLAPRFWPTWAGIAALCVIAWLPYRLRMAIGNLLGRATWYLARERRYITAINIQLCFSELGASEQHRLVLQCFIENGIGLVETATGWVRPPRHFLDRLVMQGTEHLDAALATGRGVLMLGAHYSTLDFGANLLSVHYPFAVTYRAHRNPLFDAFMLRGRLRNCNGVFDRRDIRGAFRHLKQGKILWYAPDQDYGPDQAVFVPFFGNCAATITAASRFAAFNASPVVLVRQQRMPQGKYLLDFIPLSPPLPSGDDSADASAINAAIERAIRMAPAQYLWMHKRFKTQPGGKPESPYIHIRTPDKKLSENQYASLIADARPLRNGEADTTYLQLRDGLCLRELHGHQRGLLRKRHAALQLDSISKDLRSHGIGTVTIDNIFRVASRNVTAVTAFLPGAQPLTPANAVPAAAADFLGRLHNSGFHFAQFSAANLAIGEKGVVIIDPLQIGRTLGGAAWHERMRDVECWLTAFPASDAEQDALLDAYAAMLRPFDLEGMRALLVRHDTHAHAALARRALRYKPRYSRR